MNYLFADLSALELFIDVYKRQGQNLPDKEFRYLRTVIVTAAVHWGFNSMLAHLLLTFQHRAGVSSYTSSFDLAQTCVFGKQSVSYTHLDVYKRQ